MSSGVVSFGGRAPRRWLVLGLVLAAAPALAQLDGVAPKELAEGLSQSLTSALAWSVVVLLLMLIASNVFWVRSYMKQTDERISMLHETLTSVVTLGLKQHEGLEIVDKVMDHVSSRRNDGG